MKSNSVLELCKQLKPIMGSKQADVMWQWFLLADKDEKEHIEQLLELMYETAVQGRVSSTKIMLPPPPAEISPGPFKIGNVEYLDKNLGEFGLHGNEIPSHIGIYGMSGSGKTTLAYTILKSLMERGKKVLIFDWKRNYRPLLQTPWASDIVVLTVGRPIAPLNFNILIPPKGADPKQWLKRLINVINSAYYCGHGVASLLIRAISGCYKDFGVYDGSVTSWPTMEDVERYLLSDPAGKRKGGTWLASALRTVETMNFGEMGRILNSCPDKPLPLDQLLKHNVIMELDSLDTSDREIIIDTILMYIHTAALCEAKKETVANVLVLEEAHHVVKKSDKVEGKTGHSQVDTSIRELRELGYGIIFIDQQISKISTTALANTYTTFLLSQGYPADIRTAAKIALLEKEQEVYFGQMNKGQAIVKMQGRYFQPFLINFPDSTHKKLHITDELVHKRWSDWFSRYSSAEQPAIASITPIQVLPNSTKVKKKNEGLNEFEQLLLLDVVKNPFSGIAKRYKGMQLAVGRCNDAKNALLEKGFIIEKETITRRGKIKLLEITRAGIGEINKIPDIEEHTRSEGIVHRFWKNQAMEHFRNKGYTVVEEKPLNSTGKRVDIDVFKDDEHFCIEIETRSRKQSDFGKCLKYYPNLLIIATSVLARTQVENKVEKLTLEQQRRVKIMLGSDLA